MLEKENMVHVGTKVPPDLYSRIKADATNQNISLSEFVRHRLTEVYRDNKKEGENPANAEVHSVHHMLGEQLKEKDDQIRELHQLLAMSQKTTATLTDQLDAIKQLEDMREQSWWRRVFRQK